MGFREAIQQLVDDNLNARWACAEDDDCPCSYKDCYECGMWHNCHHTPLTSVAQILAEHPEPRSTGRPPHPNTMAGRGNA